jgi:hypothetical protein
MNDPNAERMLRKYKGFANAVKQMLNQEYTFLGGDKVVCRNCCNFLDALYPTTITLRPSINTYYPLSTPH